MTTFFVPRIVGRDDLTSADLVAELAAIRAAIERHATAIELLATHLARLDSAAVTMDRLARIPALCMPPGSFPQFEREKQK